MIGAFDVKWMGQPHKKYIIESGLFWGVLVVLLIIMFIHLYWLKRDPTKNNKRKIISKFGFLVVGYQDKYYFWEYIIWVRKSILTFIIVSFQNSFERKTMQFMLLAILTVYFVSILIQRHFQPFMCIELNKLERNTLSFACIALLLGLM